MGVSLMKTGPRVAETVTVDPTLLSYLAGFVDGEGCIVIIKTQTQYQPAYCLHLEVTNCNKEVLDLFADTFKRGTVLKFKDRINWRPCWVYQSSSRQAAEILQLLLPFLRVKKNQALLGIEFQKIKSGQHRGRWHPLTSVDLRIREMFRTQISHFNGNSKGRFKQ